MSGSGGGSFDAWDCGCLFRWLPKVGGGVCAMRVCVQCLDELTSITNSVLLSSFKIFTDVKPYSFLTHRIQRCGLERGRERPEPASLYGKLQLRMMM